MLGLIFEEKSIKTKINDLKSLSVIASHQVPIKGFMAGWNGQCFIVPCHLFGNLLAPGHIHLTTKREKDQSEPSLPHVLRMCRHEAERTHSCEPR